MNIRFSSGSEQSNAHSAFIFVSRSMGMTLAAYYRMEARRSLLVAGLSSDSTIIQRLQEEAARFQALADKAEADEQRQKTQ